MNDNFLGKLYQYDVKYSMLLNQILKLDKQLHTIFSHPGFREKLISIVYKKFQLSIAIRTHEISKSITLDTDTHIINLKHISSVEDKKKKDRFLKTQEETILLQVVKILEDHSISAQLKNDGRNYVALEKGRRLQGLTTFNRFCSYEFYGKYHEIPFLKLLRKEISLAFLSLAAIYDTYMPYYIKDSVASVFENSYSLFGEYAHEEICDFKKYIDWESTRKYGFPMENTLRLFDILLS